MVVLGLTGAPMVMTLLLEALRFRQVRTVVTKTKTKTKTKTLLTPAHFAG